MITHWTYSRILLYISTSDISTYHQIRDFKTLKIFADQRGRSLSEKQLVMLEHVAKASIPLMWNLVTTSSRNLL